MMRRLVIDTIISLDGYYTGNNGEIDWFEFNDQEIEWSKQILRRVDTMLYGRVTYEEFSQFWPNTTPSNGVFDSEIIEQLNGLKKVVFSKSLCEVKWQPAVLIREDPVEAVRDLKKDDGKDMLIVGSGTLVSALLKEGLIDEYHIRVRPILLGTGKHLFPDDLERHDLKLISARAFANGVVALHYEPITLKSV